jgi:hypothetical protein
MNKIDIEKIKRWKGHADFYKSMINEFYQRCIDCGVEDEDRFYDYFYNDVITLDEFLSDQELSGEIISLEQVSENEDGSADFSFEYADEFAQIVSEQTGIESPSEDDIGNYIVETLVKASEEIIENEKKGIGAPF